MSDILLDVKDLVIHYETDDGLVQAESAAEPGSVKSYDLTSQDRIVRGRMPTLEMINERFARYTRISMFNLLRRSADVAVGGVLDAEEVGVLGEGPWATFGPDGSLLAVYERFRAGSIKPSLVLA